MLVALGVLQMLFLSQLLLMEAGLVNRLSESILVSFCGNH